MSTKVYKYILDFSAQTNQFGKQVGGMKGMLKGAAVAAGALFAADKVMDAAKAVADYAQEISKVRTEIGTLTGVQGAALDTLTGQVQALSDSYDQDVNATIKASNILMREFGATGQKAFDIMNAGFASTADSNEDFLQQLNEYAPHFAEAGASAEEMLAVIAQGNKMGIFSDKAADSIKEGGIRLREMTQSTQDALNMIGLSSKQIQQDISSGNRSMFEVMQLVSKQLQTLPQQSPAVGAALADIFGGPGEDAVNFIRQLGDMDLSMQNVVDNATRAQMEWTAELAEFHTVGAQVFGGTSQMIMRVKTVMMGWVNDSIKGIVNLTNYFIDLYNESDAFRAGVEAVRFAFKTMFDFVGTQFQSFFELFKGAGKVIKAIFTGDWKSIGDIISGTFETIGDNATDFGTRTAANFMDGVGQTLTPREKVKLISISSDEAEAAGLEAGKSFARGLTFGQALGGGGDMSMVASVGAQVNFSGDKEIKSLSDQQYEAGQISFAPVLGDMSYLYEQAEAAKQVVADMAYNMQEKVWAVQGAFQQGFAQVGNSIVAGLGLAEDGFEGFVGGLLQTTVQLISMMMAQSIASSIAGATASAAATGPGAIFAQPAFLATMIGGVLAAFASIPKFEFGGVVGGSSFAGDKMLIRANSGEEVLRRDDPRHVDNYGRSAAAGAQAPRDRVIIPSVKIKKGDIVIAYHEGQKELSRRNGN